MSFSDVGVRAVIAGMGSFEADARKFDTVIAKMVTSTTRAGTQTSIAFQGTTSSLQRMAVGALSLSAIGRTIQTAFSPITSIFGGVSRSLGRIFETAAGFVAANIFGKLASSMRDFAYNAIDAVAQIERLEVGMTGLLAREIAATQNAGKLSDQWVTISDVFPEAEKQAKSMMDELARIAILSPYQLEMVANTYRTAMAFGLSSKQARLFTDATLNVAAGIGASTDMLERMAYNLAQVRLQGSVTKLDIRQLALAGFDLVGVLRDVGRQFGIAIEDEKDFNEAIASGKLTWDDFINGYYKYATQNFQGASERMARTLYGLKSTFKDVFQLTIPKILGPSVDKIVDTLNRFLNIFLKIRESKILDLVGERLANAFGALPKPIARALDFLEQYADLVTGIAQSSDPTAIMYMSRQLQELTGGNTLRAFISAVFGPVGTTIFDTVSGAIDRLKNSGIVAYLDGVKKAVEDAGLGSTEFWEALTKFLPEDLQTSVLGFIDNLGKAYENLKLFWDTNGPAILGSFTQITDAILGAGKGGAKTALDDMGLGIVGLTENLNTNAPTIVQKIQEIADVITLELIPALQSEEFKTKGGGIVNGLLAMAASIGILSAASSVIPAIVTLFTGGLLALGGPVVALGALLGLLVYLISVYGAQAWITLQQIVFIIGYYIGVLIAFIGSVVSSASTSFNQIIFIIGYYGGLMISKFSEIATSIGKSVGEWVAIITGFVTGFYNAGSAILQGFWDGLVAKFEEIKKWWEGTVATIIQTYKDALNINSPSLVFKDIGEGVLEGFMMGLESMIPAVDALMSDKILPLLVPATPAPAVSSIPKSTVYNYTKSQTNNITTRTRDDAQFLAYEIARENARRAR